MNSSSLVLLTFPVALLVFCKNFYDLLLYTFITFMGSIIGALHCGNIDLTGCKLVYNYVKEYVRDIKLRNDRIFKIEFYDSDHYLCFDLQGKKVITNLKMQPIGIEKGIKIGLRVFDYQTEENIMIVEIADIEGSGI